MTWNPITLSLPAWAEEIDTDPRLEVEDRMEFVVGLARSNVEQETGGPFGAAVFEEETGRLISPGVNRVVPTALSFAHAEIMAIGGANTVTGEFDLGGPGQPALQLVASTEPCALCLGATVWSGVRSIVTGARDEDARRIGFDEGPKVSDWVGALEKRGIAVTVDVLREESVAVLEAYAASGQIIYNGRRDA